ncbi:MAG: DUF72 domain-containing protein [Vicinamibacterales bacterium]
MADTSDPSREFVRIGTSGWSYPQGRGTWTGVFYPPASSTRRLDELAYYAERFDTVEVNSTFYRLPSPQTTASWVRRTGARFTFSVKLFQKFTHPAMFAERHPGADVAIDQMDVDSVRAALDPLAVAGKLGPLLAQFPPSFDDSAEARDYVSWLLRAFHEFPMAVELRHRSWSDDAVTVQELLTSQGATWVFIDEPKFALSVTQRLSAAQGPFGYWRFHGRNARNWWKHDASEDRYDYLYSKEELEPFAEAASASRRLMKKLYLYMNNHFESKAVANALMLKSSLGLDIEGRYHEGLLQRFPELRGFVPAEAGQARLI